MTTGGPRTTGWEPLPWGESYGFLSNSYIITFILDNMQYVDQMDTYKSLFVASTLSEWEINE